MEYNFGLDKKYTTWYSQEFSIEAESEEEAIKLAKEYAEGEANPFEENKSAKFTDDYWEEQEIDDCLEEMEAIENEGNPTRELYLYESDTEPLYFRKRREIWDNKILYRPMWLRIKELLDSKEGWDRIGLEAQLGSIINEYEQIQKIDSEGEAN